jgi:hypothetical protein
VNLTEFDRMEREEAQVTVDLEDESDGIVLKNMARLSVVFGMHKRCSFCHCTPGFQDSRFPVIDNVRESEKSCRPRKFHRVTRL